MMHIIFYALDSPSDFTKLGKEVTTRLKAQLKKNENLQTLASLSPVKATEGLSTYEIAAMISIMQNRLTPDDTVTPHDLRNDMRKAGYTKVATGLSIEGLKRKGMIEFEEARADNFGNTYTVIKLSDRGVDWMLENRERFRLSIEEEPEPESADEDIPF